MTLWANCGITTRYVCSIHVYNGNEDNMPKEDNEGNWVVLDMLKGIEKSCRNITADKFESVGRIREAEANTFRNHTKKSQKNKASITTKDRVVNFTLFLFQKLATILS